MNFFSIYNQRLQFHSRWSNQFYSLKTKKEDPGKWKVSEKSLRGRSSGKRYHKAVYKYLGSPSSFMHMFLIKIA